MKVSLASAALLSSAVAADVNPAGGYHRNLVVIRHGNGQPIFAYIPAPPSTTIAIYTARGLGSRTVIEQPYYDWGPVRIERPSWISR
ncbi:MAG: hypothetical protein JWL90_2168 [Chthoniobacteraceae bacterium]|nr:hypothetical protein [Chthoniobacteraceae bacterium]